MKKIRFVQLGSIGFYSVLFLMASMIIPSLSLFAEETIRYYHTFRYGQDGSITFDIPIDDPKTICCYHVLESSFSPFVTVTPQGKIQENTPMGYPKMRPIQAVYRCPDGIELERLSFDSWGRLSEIDIFNSDGNRIEVWKHAYDPQGRLTAWYLYDQDHQLTEERRAEYYTGINLAQQYVLWKCMSPQGMLRWYSKTWFGESGNIREWHQYDHNNNLLIQLTYEYDLHGKPISCKAYSAGNVLQYYRTFSYFAWGGLSTILHYHPDGILERVWVFDYFSSKKQQDLLMDTHFPN